MAIVNFASDFELFRHENLGSVRTLVDETGMAWFVAKDVCDILDIRNSRDALTRLDEDEKANVGIADISSNGTNQTRNFNIVNESGMYSLVLTSRKPQAKEFKKWLTSYVIPSIRQHGGYVYGQERLTKEESTVIKEELSDMAAMVKKLRARRHELIGQVSKLKDEKRQLKKEHRALGEYADLFEDMFDKAQAEYAKAAEEVEVLKNRLERVQHPERFVEVEAPLVFVGSDGLVYTNESVWDRAKELREEQEGRDL